MTPDRPAWLLVRSAPQRGGIPQFGRVVAQLSGSLPPRLWTPQYLLSLFGTFLHFACFFYLATTLPSELNDLGATVFEVGLIVGGYNLLSILLRPFVGRWSDGGRRLLQMRIGALAFGLSFAAMIFAADVWTLFFLRCTHGIAMAAYPTAAGSLVAEIVPQRRRGEGLGFFGMATSVPQTAAPVLGGLIAVAGGFDAVLIVGVFTAGASILLTFAQREPPNRREGSAPPMSLRALVPAPAVFPMLVFLSVTLGFSAAIAFLPLLADEGGSRDLGEVSLFFLFSGGGAILTRPLAGRTSDRIGRVPVIVPGLIATAIGLAVLARAETAPMLWAAGLISGIGLGAAHTCLLAMAVDRVSSTQRGGATAVFQMAWDLGGFLGGPILGAVGSVIDVETIFWAASAGAVLALAGLLFGRVMGWTQPLPLPIPTPTAAPAAAAAGGGD